jgi:anti-anti-sigma factor
VTVGGEIDLVSGGPLRTALAARLDRRPAGLVVDLSGVVFFGAAGITALVTAAAQARAHGVPMVVVTDRPIVLRPLRVTATDRDLHLQPTVDCALSALTGSQPTSSACSPVAV